MDVHSVYFNFFNFKKLSELIHLIDLHADDVYWFWVLDDFFEEVRLR